MNEKIIERAKLMANDKIPDGCGKYWHSIKSNPYHQKIGKAKKNSSHTQWHNAFVDECNRIGRNIK